MRSLLFMAAVLAIGGTAKADTFVNGERYAPGQFVYVDYSAPQACSPAEIAASGYQVVYATAGACSTPQAASACSTQGGPQAACGSAGSSGSARAGRNGPVRRLFGRLFSRRCG